MDLLRRDLHRYRRGHHRHFTAILRRSALRGDRRCAFALRRHRSVRCNRRDLRIRRAVRHFAQLICAKRRLQLFRHARAKLHRVLVQVQLRRLRHHGHLHRQRVSAVRAEGQRRLALLQAFHIARAIHRRDASVAHAELAEAEVVRLAVHVVARVRVVQLRAHLLRHAFANLHAFAAHRRSVRAQHDLRHRAHYAHFALRAQSVLRRYGDCRPAVVLARHRSVRRYRRDLRIARLQPIHIFARQLFSVFVKEDHRQLDGTSADYNNPVIFDRRGIRNLLRRCAHCNSTRRHLNVVDLQCNDSFAFAERNQCAAYRIEFHDFRIVRHEADAFRVNISVFG